MCQRQRHHLASTIVSGRVEDTNVDWQRFAMSYCSTEITHFSHRRVPSDRRAIDRRNPEYDFHSTDSDVFQGSFKFLVVLYIYYR